MSMYLQHTVFQLLLRASTGSLGHKYFQSFCANLLTTHWWVFTVVILIFQLFKHAPFPGKWLIFVFQAFEHPRLKLLFQYPNTYTLQSLNGSRRMSTSLQQSLRSYSEGYRTSSGILQVFSNVYISKYLLDSYCHCKARTGIAKHVLAFDSLCGAWAGVAKRVLVFDSLCGARTGLGNVY